ncbi:MAG TPA: hypothetical protein VE258_10415, partial [Ktedonobacterales bacterium]|nr:hypothetical protein [Ktedonobacterales bacterium]
MRPEVAAISPLALRCAALAVALAVLQPAVAAGPSAWVSDPGVQRRLAAGEVVVQAVSGVDPERQRGTVRAAV